MLNYPGVKNVFESTKDYMVDLSKSHSPLFDLSYKGKALTKERVRKDFLTVKENFLLPESDLPPLKRWELEREYKDKDFKKKIKEIKKSYKIRQYEDLIAGNEEGSNKNVLLESIATFEDAPWAKALSDDDPGVRLWAVNKLAEVYNNISGSYQGEINKYLSSLDPEKLEKIAQKRAKNAQAKENLSAQNARFISDPKNLFGLMVMAGSFSPLAIFLFVLVVLPQILAERDKVRFNRLKEQIPTTEQTRAREKGRLSACVLFSGKVMNTLLPYLAGKVKPSEVKKVIQDLHDRSEEVIAQLSESFTQMHLQESSIPSEFDRSSPAGVELLANRRNFYAQADSLLKNWGENLQEPELQEVWKRSEDAWGREVDETHEVDEIEAPKPSKEKDSLVKDVVEGFKKHFQEQLSLPFDEPEPDIPPASPAR